MMFFLPCCFFASVLFACSIIDNQSYASDTRSFCSSMPTMCFHAGWSCLRPSSTYQPQGSWIQKAPIARPSSIQIFFFVFAPCSSQHSNFFTFMTCLKFCSSCDPRCSLSNIGQRTVNLEHSWCWLTHGRRNPRVVCNMQNPQNVHQFLFDLQDGDIGTWNASLSNIGRGTVRSEDIPSVHWLLEKEPIMSMHHKCQCAFLFQWPNPLSNLPPRGSL